MKFCIRKNAFMLLSVLKFELGTFYNWTIAALFNIDLFIIRSVLKYRFSLVRRATPHE